MAACTCNFNTQEVEVGGSGIQGHPWPHKAFKTNLGYIIHYLKRGIEEKRITVQHATYLSGVPQKLSISPRGRSGTRATTVLAREPRVDFTKTWQIFEFHLKVSVDIVQPKKG